MLYSWLAIALELNALKDLGLGSLEIGVWFLWRESAKPLFGWDMVGRGSQGGRYSPLALSLRWLQAGTSSRRPRASDADTGG